jgi:hypothetical protein
MNNFNGNVLQRNISKVFPNKLLADIAELLLLFLIGMLAITLHAKLRIPMHLPGKQGVLFMFFIVMARSMSKFSFATSISCLGASALLFFNVLGFDDPFMPLVYILLGVVMDILFGLISKYKPSVILIGVASGVCWTAIPLFRIIITSLTGFPYQSLIGGFAFSLFTHFIFGMIGGLIGAGFIYVISKKQK